MKTIYILTDYKNRFLSKTGDIPYRSGMDKDLIRRYFKDLDYDVHYLKFSDVDFKNMNFKDKFILYTSSEDYGYHYKSYIEDIIYGLHLQGAFVIPHYKYLRANNNKVFMEIIRDLSENEHLRNLQSNYYGVLEDLNEKLKHGHFSPCVLKSATGAMSKGVELALNPEQALKKAKKISKTYNFLKDLKDIIRIYYFKGYLKESRNRNKFIAQEFIPDLKNDWKVLVFDKKLYVLKRFTRENDFRSSGSGNFEFDNNVDNRLLDICKNIFIEFDVPNLSIDICFDGKEYYLFEFQAIYFGTYTLVKSPFYYIKGDSGWIRIDENSILEQVYTESIVNYINSKY